MQAGGAGTDRWTGATTSRWVDPSTTPPPRSRLRRVLRATRWVALVGLVVLLAAGGVGVWAVRAPVPDREGRVELEGLAGEVTVLRDARGVPHVYADTAEDLFLAQGWVHAQDRFFEMDLRRRITAGRLSELVGDDSAALETDRVVRVLGWRRTAEAELDGLDPDSRRWLAAYARGVDAYAAGRSPSELSLAYTVLGLQHPLPEIEPWSPVDSLAWLKALAWQLRSNYSAELGRAALLGDGLPPERVDQLYPEVPPGHPTIVRAGEAVPSGALGRPAPAPLDGSSSRPAPGLPPAAAAAAARASDALAALATSGFAGLVADGQGSNSWVVSGEHTAGGAPLLANDPHLAPASPSTFHQVGLHCREVTADCPFDVTGFSFSGVPGVFIGQNADLAWGLTTLYADSTDFAVERVVDGTMQERDGRLVPLQVRVERIDVAGAEPVRLRVREGVNGPLLGDALSSLDETAAAAVDGRGVLPDPPREGGRVEYAVALRWTGSQPGRTMDALFGINAARDVAGVARAARLLDAPGQNIVVAETGVGGAIGYVVPGAVPVRGRGDGTVPVPGWDSAYDWQGEVPREDLPVVVDPPRGWLVTANNTVLPPGTETELGVDLGEDTDLGYRARRLEERLAALVERGDVDVDDMRALQLDTRSPLVDVVVPHVVRVLQERGGRGADHAELLAGWDGTQSVDSPEAALAATLWTTLLERVFLGDLPPDTLPDGGSRWVRVVEELLERPDDPWWDDLLTPEVETRDDALEAAAAAATRELEARFGDDPVAWRWGDRHVLAPQHTPLGGTGVPGPVRRLFNLSERGVAGGVATVVATPWSPSEVGYSPTSVPAMRMVVDLGDPDASRWVDLTGVSGHPLDVHHGDQWDTWVAGEDHPMPVTAEAVRAAAQTRQELVPPAPDR